MRVNATTFRAKPVSAHMPKEKINITGYTYRHSRCYLLPDSNGNAASNNQPSCKRML